MNEKSRIRWYCCQSHVKQEHVAVKHLTQQGYKPYLPLMLTNNKHGPMIVPLFSGYVFVQFNTADSWQSIANTVGVKKLLGFSNTHPTAINDEIVDTLMSAASLYEDGKILLPGASVYFKRGDWAGSTAICQWSNSTRVELLMRILGREIHVTFHRNKLEEVL